jgi:ABC-type amino acid transport substrate-binding protein
MAGQGEVIVTRSVPASTARGLFVSGAGVLDAAARAVGCLVEGTDANETKAAVQLTGTALGVLAGETSAGDILKADAAGKLAVATGDATDTFLICAVALEAGAADELRSVKLL